MLSLVFLGGRFNIFSSAVSAAKAKPGKPSVTKLIHKICMGISGMGKPTSVAKKNVHISPPLLVREYLINFRILS